MEQKKLHGLNNMFSAARLSLEASLAINPEELVEAFDNGGTEPEWSDVKKLRMRPLSGYSMDCDDKLLNMVERIENFLNNFQSLEILDEKNKRAQEIRLAIIYAHAYYNRINKIISDLLELNSQPKELVEFYIEKVGTRYINCLVEFLAIHRSGVDGYKRKRITSYIRIQNPLNV